MESGVSTGARPSPRVLIVVKESTEARRISLFLQEEGMETVVVRDDQAGFNLLDSDQIDALIAETRSPHVDGLRLLRVARMRNPDVCAILLAGPKDLDLATRALDEGAHDYQTRPINLEKILAVIRRGMSVQRLVGEMHEMARRLDRKIAFGNLVGSSAPFVRAYNRILHVCGIDAPVLIVGESGTGRRHVARAIHQNSARRSSSLVALDCEGLEAGFLEREMFGEETDARPRPGRIDLAEGGTFVIEEVDAVPLSVQGRLLRLMRDKEFERVGGRTTQRPDVRVLAIGSESLRNEVERGAFRADLYDNLRAVTIEMPPLRHRKRDIPLLTEYFLEEACETNGCSVSGIKPAAMECMRRYAWPGNVRELKSVIRGIVLSLPSGGAIDVSDLPDEIRRNGPSDADEIVQIPVGLGLAEAERRLIMAALKRSGGDRGEAARVLGIGLRTLQRRLAHYRLLDRRNT